MVMVKRGQEWQRGLDRWLHRHGYWEVWRTCLVAEEVLRPVVYW